MTRSTAQYVAQGGSVAAYKAYQGAISAQLNAVLTKTGDTGQVNWNTVATEPVVVRDYEIFQFSDSLQATYPIYLRFDYIGGTTTANNKIQVTVGTTTDGAGNLGGVTIAAATLHGGFVPTGSTKTVYASSDGSYLTLMYNMNPSAGYDNLAALVVERTRNVDGTINNHGLMCWRWQATGDAGAAGTSTFAGTTSRIFAGGTQPAVNWDYGAMIPNLTNASTYFSVDTSYAFPVYGWAPMPEGASKALLFGFQNDFPRDSEITLQHYGTAMKFLAQGPAANANFIGYMTNQTISGSKTNFCPLFRWE